VERCRREPQGWPPPHAGDQGRRTGPHTGLGSPAAAAAAHSGVGGVGAARGSQGVGAVVTKNWEPLVLGPALAMDRMPDPVCFSSRVISSSNFPPWVVERAGNGAGKATGGDARRGTPAGRGARQATLDNSGSEQPMLRQLPAREAMGRPLNKQRTGEDARLT
jgi:hypothetical protein